MGAFNSSLTLYKGFVGDSSYKNVFYIDNKADYILFLNDNFSPLAFNSNMYIIKDGTIRVNHSTFDVINKYNYLTFTNFTDLSTKVTFFAFITDVKYINDNCSEIIYEIDLWSSYLPLCTLKQGFIERGHTATDDLWEHTLPEPVTSDEIITRTINKSGFMNAWSLVLLNTFKINGTTTDDVYLDYVNGALMPLYPLVFNIITNVDTEAGLTIDETELNNAVAILEDLIKVQGKINNIHKAFLFPTAFINLNNRNVEIKTQTLSFGEPMDFALGSDTYTPKNNKMYCYPYNYLEVDNGSESMKIRYDYIKSRSSTFNFYSSLSPNPNILVKLGSGFSGYTYLNNLTLSNFPSIMFDKSILNEFIKNGGNIEASNLMFGALQTFLGGVSGGMSAGFNGGTGNASGAISTINQGLQNYNDQKNYSMKLDNLRRQGDQVLGSYNVSIAHSLGLVDFFFKNNQLKPEVARTIDEYFTRYGYTLNKVGVPNLQARQYYTYLKVSDLELTGNITQKAKSSIKAIFNNGVTIWKQSAIDNFGDYSNNPIIT